MKSKNSGEIPKKSMTMNKSKDIVNEKKLGPQKKFCHQNSNEKMLW